MGSKFLKATLLNGLAIVAEFSSLKGSGEGYSTQVFAGVKPFNAWKVLGTTHPTSGEPNVLVRTRVMYPGSQIASIERVQPTIEPHNYDPANFVPVVEVQHGENGMWTGDGTDGTVAGQDYPIHRDAETDHRRYVIVSAATGAKHWIDTVQAASGEREDDYAPVADADDDLDL